MELGISKGVIYIPSNESQANFVREQQFIVATVNFFYSTIQSA
jgi:hypothetical protein